VVFGVKLVKVDVKEPMPVPFDVFVVKVIVGLVLVDQTTPLAVMEAPPSTVIFPPEVDEVAVMEVISVVESEGIDTMENVSLRQRTEAPTVLP
jgi:hypothetical protein